MKHSKTFPEVPAGHITFYSSKYLEFFFKSVHLCYILCCLVNTYCMMHCPVGYHWCFCVNNTVLCLYIFSNCSSCGMIIYGTTCNITVVISRLYFSGQTVCSNIIVDLLNIVQSY